MRAIFFFLCWLPVLASAAEYPLQAGDTLYEMPLQGEAALPLYTHRPEGIVDTAPVMIVMHGNTRDADRYLHQWRDLADQYGFFLLVPEFGRPAYQKSRHYNLGNIIDASGQVREESSWSFSRVEQAFDFYRQQQNIQTNEYQIYGHSAGAQFVHRFLFHLPESRANRLVAANAGWYTMPDLAENWPYGLKGSVVAVEGLKVAFNRPLLILLGDQDTDPQHSSLRRAPEAMLQGPHRFARGYHFFESGQAKADSLETPYRWRLQTVPGVAHDNRGMAVAAARYLFEDAP